MCEVIETLYTITQTQTPIHADWNKAFFTLYPDGKVNMEYIWDAEWQAERDANKAKVQKELERRRKISESLRKKKTEQLMENEVNEIWQQAVVRYTFDELDPITIDYANKEHFVHGGKGTFQNYNEDQKTIFRVT